MDRIQLTTDPTIAEALRRVQNRPAPAARTTEMSPADVAAHAATSYVRTSLTPAGTAALHRIETRIARWQR